MRPPYAEYVKSAMRFYARNRLAPVPQEPRFRTDADKKNWAACEAAVKPLEPVDREWVLRIYADADTLADNIYDIAAKNGISQNHLWDMINAVEKRFAKRRGLI